MKRYLLPLLVFVVLAVFLAIGLKRDPNEVPSPLIGKSAPAFDLPQLANPEQRLSSKELRGQVWLLNVWASWCLTCREEQPLLVEAAKANKLKIYGLNYKDKRGDALAWLKNFGNPYVQSVSDSEGLVAIDYGVYGVPETFVIDKQGVIRYKQIGPVTPEALRDTLLPLLAQLEQAAP